MTEKNNNNLPDTAIKKEVQAVQENECLASEDGHHHAQPLSQSHACKHCGQIF